MDNNKIGPESDKHISHKSEMVFNDSEDIRAFDDSKILLIYLLKIITLN